jgi:hypothetical protein
VPDRGRAGDAANAAPREGTPVRPMFRAHRAANNPADPYSDAEEIRK